MALLADGCAWGAQTRVDLLYVLVADGGGIITCSSGLLGRLSESLLAETMPSGDR